MNVALIPVRGGSKSIPLKNIKELAGKPLVYWTAKAANECKYIDKVYIATDSGKIADTVKQLLLEKVEVIGRSPESASDTASTEFVMLEFAGKYDFDNIVLIQATSPLLTAEDLDKGFEKMLSSDCDSVMSVVPQKRFYWSYAEDGSITATNYDVYQRPRRQEFDGSLAENGAFYITSKRALLETKNRVSGKIGAVEMCEDSFFEIDEPEDWAIIQTLLQIRLKKASNAELSNIKMFLTDCDGCLTDGGMYYSENGDELKKFNAKDGMGFRLLREKGIITGIITGETRNLNRSRAEKIKVDILEAGIQDKLATVKTLCEKYRIDLQNVAYVGDDINDLDVVKAVGFGCCVADGVQEVKDAAVYVTKRNGGQGAVREVIDLVVGQTNKIDI